MLPLVALGAAGLAAGGSIAGSMIQANSAETINRMQQEYDSRKTQWLMDDASRRAEQAYGWEKEFMSRQEDFQERMSSTAYQRATADMEKAGINPMLAYMQGGASSPPGASGKASSAGPGSASGPALNVPEIGKGVERAITNALSTAMEVSSFKKTMQEKDANIAATEASAEASKAQALLTQASAKRLGVEMPAIEAEAKARAKHGLYDKDYAPYDAIINRLRQLIPFTVPRGSGGSGSNTPMH